MATPEGTPKNIDVNSLNRLPEKRQTGWGVRKSDNLSPQGEEKPVFEKPLISEAQRLANEQWRAINKRMERYTQEQEGKIHEEFFDRSTAWFKSHGFTTQNIGREVQKPETRMEMAAIFEECMASVDKSLDDQLETQRPDTPSEQETSGDSSGGSST
jgi:hypothetical protein